MEWKHVVVGDSIAGSLKVAFTSDPLNAFRGEVRNFREDLSVGRINRLMENYDDRYEWYLRITKGTEFGSYLEERLETYLEEAYGKTLDFSSDDRIVIWHSGIVSEQVALRYFAERLTGHEMWEVNVSKQRVRQWNGVKTYPRSVGECAPEELLEAINGMEVMSAERIQQLRLEWAELLTKESTLRILEGNQILSVEETFYDQQLLSLLTERFQPAARVVGALMGTSDQIIGDTFLNYRLLQLIAAGKVEWQGSLRALRYYQVRITG